MFAREATTVAAAAPSRRSDRRRRLTSGCLGVLTVVALWLLAPQVAAADAATLNLTPGSDPVEETSIAIGVSGQALSNRSVYVEVASGDVPCASTESDNYGARIGTYSTASGGSFSHSPTYTPGSAGTYTVCGYVATSSYATPDATKRATFTVRHPNATLSLSPSGDVVEETSMSVQVAGATEGPARSVYVEVSAGDVPCAATESDNYGARIGTYATDSGGGTFTRTATYTPSSPGTYTVCGYVAESEYATPDATKRAMFTARHPRATVSLSPSKPVGVGTAVSVVVAGTTEGPARSVYVEVSSGDMPCAPTESENYGARIGTYSTDSGGDTFSRTATFTPSSYGPHTVCGYVAESEYAAPDASQQASFMVPGGPSSGADADADDSYSDEEAELSVPAPTLLSPADRASGVLLNPTFQWTADPASGVKGDTLRIDKEHADGSRTRLAGISSDTYTAYYNDAGKYKPNGIDYYLKDLATFRARGNVVTVKLESRLAPGTYSWFVSRKDPDNLGRVYSARRTLVIHGQPLRKVKLRLHSHAGSSSKFPGTTDIDVRTAPYSNVRFELRRNGRRSVLAYQADESGYAGFTKRWTCSLPGGRYRVNVTARDEYGATKRATGWFRPVTKKRCRSMRRAEAAARRARARRIAARERARARREAQAEARRNQRFRNNCSTIGGIPRIVQRSDGPYTVCVAPFGGLLPVPQ